MVESSIVIHRNDIISYSKGTAGQVEFDFEQIWCYCKIMERKASELDFYHVHPAGFLELSQTDVNCMKGFREAFGCQIKFYIITFTTSKMLSTLHNCLGYKITDEREIVELRNIEYNHLHKNSLLFLKYLSYGGEK